MAELINKLHIKYNNVIDECTCYTTPDEATPKTISKGSYWEIKNNNIVCYLGLWPVSETKNSGFHSMLTMKKNGIDYYVEKQVVNEFTVTINQSANQTIKVTCNGYTYTSTFKALVGSKFTVIVEPKTGYNAGTPNYYSGTITDNVTISASAATLKQFTVTINQSTNQTIKVVCNGQTYTSTFKANYGSTYTATVTPNTGYNAGTLNHSSGTITNNITISATPATIKQFTVTITQSSNQTIKVVCNGTSHTSSFTANYGSTYTATVTPNTGYNAGTLNHTSGTITGNITISATTATLKQFTVTINQSANQTIKVVCNGKTYTSSFAAPYGSTYTATVTPNTGYNAGTISSASGTITNNITISATPATIKQFTVTITQSSNQTITVKCNNQSHTSSFTANYGSTYTASVTPNTGYNAGTISSASGTITGNITISATAATIKQFTVTITQSANQTITVKCNGTNHTSTFTAPYGSTYTALIVVSNSVYYTPGTLNHTSGTITGNITISATPATLKRYTITVTQPANGKITVNGNVGTSFTYNAGTSVTIQATANSGYKVAALNVDKVTKTLSTNIIEDAEESE